MLEAGAIIPIFFEVVKTRSIYTIYIGTVPYINYEPTMLSWLFIIQYLKSRL